MLTNLQKIVFMNDQEVALYNNFSRGDSPWHVHRFVYPGLPIDSF